MSLTWQGVTFHDTETWRTLLNYCCCRIPKEMSPDPILNQLSGSIQTGELIALMGPSGAGKSTFFNILTTGKHFGKVQGSIFVSTPPGGTVARCSYLTQHADDHLLPNLTVKESLRYASKLKNQHFSDSEDHEKVVRKLIKELNLTEVADKATRTCSGGQKKRLAIGLELTAKQKPQFLLLDEPLSGLDSCVGLEVIVLLATFSKKYSMATIVTIHQPSYEILAHFSQAYIISKLGQCIFKGPPRSMTQFLRQNGYKSGPNDNPADNMIKIASSVERGKPNPTPLPADVERNPETDDQKALRQLQRICLQMAATVLSITVGRPARSADVIDSGICQNNDASFTFRALLTLFSRSAVISFWRQKKLIMIRAGLHIVVAAVLAGLYNREIGTVAGCFVPKGLDPKNCSCVPTEEELRKEPITTQNVKFQFFSLLFLMFAALMPTVLTIPTEIKLFLNEHRNGWYTTLSYYISKTIIEIPVQLCLSGGYTVFLYWYSEQVGIELDRWYFGWRFLHFLMVTWISCFIAQGLGFLIGTICVDSFSISVILSSSVLLFLFLFSGFFVKVIEMKPSVNWITNLSFIRFSLESLLVTLYGFDRCDTSGPIKQAPIVLYTFGLEDADYVTNWIWLCVHLIVTRIMAYVCLKAKAEPNFLTLNNGHSCAKAVTKKLTPCCKKLGQALFVLIKFIMVLFLVQLILALIIGGIASYRTSNIE